MIFMIQSEKLIHMKSSIYGVGTPMAICMGYKMADCRVYLSTAGCLSAYEWHWYDFRIQSVLVYAAYYWWGTKINLAFTTYCLV